MKSQLRQWLATGMWNMTTRMAHTPRRESSASKRRWATGAGLDRAFTDA